MSILICVYDFGLTKQRGRHFWQIAIESLDCESGFTSLIGRMSVEGMGVALCGALTMISDSSSVGWCINLKKLYEPGSFNGFYLMLYSFSS